MVNIISDYVQLISLNMKLNKFLLSMTIISVGNTTGDLFANMSLSKKSMGSIAFFSTFSNQGFNFVFGFAVNNFFKIFNSEDQRPILLNDFYKTNNYLDKKLILFLLFFTFIILVYS